MKKLFRLGFAIILLAGCLIYIYHNRHVLNTLQMVPFSISLIALAFCVGAIIFHLISNLLILRVYAPSLRFFEFAALRVTGTIVNMLVPLGSVSTKALYLKTVKTMLYRDFILSHSLAGALRLAVYGGCLLATLGFVHMSRSYAGISLWVACSLITVFGFFLSALLFGVFKIPFRIYFLQRFYSGHLPKMTGLAKPVLIYTFMGALLNFLGAGLIFSSLVDQISAFIPGGFVGLAGGILVVLPITPGNLGSFQAIGGVVSHSLGYEPVVGILASLLLTALRYVGMAVLGFAAYFGFNNGNQVPDSRFSSK